MNMPEMTLLYSNQADFTYKEGQKMYYMDIFVIGQILPAFESFDLQNYIFKSNESKIIRPQYYVVSEGY